MINVEIILYYCSDPGNKATFQINQLHGYVEHFCSLQIVIYRLPPPSIIPQITLYEFLGQILRTPKSIELGISCSDNVQLAVLPSNSNDFENDLEIIDTDDKLQEELRSHYKDYRSVKTMYLFEPSKGSIQDQLSNITSQLSDIVSNSAASQSSEESSCDSAIMSEIIRSHSDFASILRVSQNTCAICGALRDYPGGLYACHLLEFNSVSRKRNEHTQHCNSLGLAQGNDARNYLCLCKTCHNNFDEYNIAIDPYNSNLIISPKILDNPVNNITYRDLVFKDGKPTNRKLKHVDGEIYRHPSRLIQYRHRLYELEQEFGILSKQQSLLMNKISSRKIKRQAGEGNEKETEDPYETLRDFKENFDDLKVNQLRDMLRSVEMPVYGKKPELIERLRALKHTLAEIEKLYYGIQIPVDTCTKEDFEEALKYCKFCLN